MLSLDKFPGLKTKPAMNKISTFLVLITLAIFLQGFQHKDSVKPAYIIYDANGSVIDYSDMEERALSADLIFFGEEHNSAIAHWLQLELLMGLAADSLKSTSIGMEMFEADQQVLIDEYFSGIISQSSFESEARLWDNYQTDYKPVLEFARENELNLIATNIPRRYASLVYSRGLSVLDSLSNQAKEWVAPLPIEVDMSLPGYQNMMEAAQGHGGDNLIYAQAVKDATMAHFILLNMGINDRLIHLNGSYHSANREGIIWYIEEAVSGYDIFTINTITAEDITAVDTESLQEADVTIVVPSSMTTTY
jgi:uncharacterized iron-regulated protein